MIRFIFIGYFLSWRKRFVYGYTEPEPYIIVMKGWRLRVLGLTLWRVFEDVKELSLNDYLARVPFGEHAISPKNYAELEAAYTPITEAMSK